MNVEYLIAIIIFLFSFLCGAIPTGYLIGKKFYDTDIRTKGSGNIGSTNVNRILGRKASIYTQIVDIIKGIIPVVLVIFLISKFDVNISKDLSLSVAAVAVVLGHDFTPFLNFRGGKGVNTTVGAFFFIATLPCLIAIISYFTLKLVTNIVSIRSIALGFLLLTMCILLAMPLEITSAAAIAFALLVLRHKDNLIRLARHEEK